MDLRSSSLSRIWTVHVYSALLHSYNPAGKQFCPTGRGSQQPPDTNLCTFHRCRSDHRNVFLRFFLFRSRFYVFLNVFFIFFSTFFILKKTSNAKYKCVKIQRKIFLEDDLAMIFIDFGLLRSLYCKISYLLAEEHRSHTNLGI